MSGTPQKMLEHLLETQVMCMYPTRRGLQPILCNSSQDDTQFFISVVGPNDPFLDDFLLTHIVFLPVPRLIDELANQYPFQQTNC